MLPLAAVSALPWRWIIGAVIVGGSLFAADRHGAGRVQRAWDAERATLQAQHDAAEAELRRFEQRRATQLQEAADAQVKTAARARADAAGARTELARLRQRLAALPAAQAAGDAGAAGRSGGPATAADVLSECAGELQRMGQAADAMSVQVSGLHAWIAAACTAPEPSPE